ncbi:TIGR03086 family metal-binding protein [Streptomyces jietaisiensis]|uniref:TIGR03086 family metal-binding protein n=1 Tax=Streptomyces griseoaurantiacus TaxID=68213 RepID=UPI002E2BFFFA|nr:TIGR03086 family metal-binding protein [Streptomyces jietaisiensis]
MDATTVDLGPQTLILARLAEGIGDAQLDGPTPCPAYTVSGMLAHLLTLSLAFRDAGRKRLGPMTDGAPDPAAAALPPGWRAELPKALEELAAVWREPAAWGGMTRAGGLDLPGAVAGAVVADELVVHGWDLARATGQEYAPDEAALRLAHGLLEGAAAETGEGRGMFGPVVAVPEGAPLLDRTVGLSGRTPDWRP